MLPLKTMRIYLDYNTLQSHRVSISAQNRNSAPKWCVVIINEIAVFMRAQKNMGYRFARNVNGKKSITFAFK